MPHSFTLFFAYPRSTLTCSIERAVRKHDAPQQKGIMPPLASPALAPTMFCSAMPTLTKRSGNRSRNPFSLVEPTESFTTAHTRSSPSAISSSVEANATRQSKVSAEFTAPSFIAHPSSAHPPPPPALHPRGRDDAIWDCFP